MLLKRTSPSTNLFVELETGCSFSSSKISIQRGEINWLRTFFTKNAHAWRCMIWTLRLYVTFPTPLLVCNWRPSRSWYTQTSLLVHSMDPYNVDGWKNESESTHALESGEREIEIQYIQWIQLYCRCLLWRASSLASSTAVSETYEDSHPAIRPFSLAVLFTLPLSTLSVLASDRLLSAIYQLFTVAFYPLIGYPIPFVFWSSLPHSFLCNDSLDCTTLHSLPWGLYVAWCL